MFDDNYYLKNRPFHIFMSFMIGAAVASWAWWYQTTILRKPYTAVVCNLNNDSHSDVVVFNYYKRAYIFLGSEHGLKLVENAYAPENAHLLKKVKELKLDEIVKE
ncbi:hypothetical protein HY485_03515 [Candidatus Woesearchaeota archaeon]|nr:hypothetical protein [Candidatus Woesearchaeota archaeon]